MYGEKIRRIQCMFMSEDLFVPDTQIADQVKT